MRENDAFRLIQDPIDAAITIAAILLLVALLPEILTHRVLI